MVLVMLLMWSIALRYRSVELEVSTEARMCLDAGSMSYAQFFSNWMWEEISFRQRRMPVSSYIISDIRSS